MPKFYWVITGDHSMWVRQVHSAASFPKGHRIAKLPVAEGMKMKYTVPLSKDH